MWHVLGRRGVRWGWGRRHGEGEGEWVEGRRMKMGRKKRKDVRDEAVEDVGDHV